MSYDTAYIHSTDHRQENRRTKLQCVLFFFEGGSKGHEIFCVLVIMLMYVEESDDRKTKSGSGPIHQTT